MENNVDMFNNLVTDGIQFLRSMTEYYGNEKGMEMWHDLGRVMGDEVQGQIFFAMLNGGSGNVVNIRANIATNPDINAVSAIKCIREYTNCGLREAKDMWDLSRATSVRVKVDPRRRRDFVRDMRNIGMTAN